MNLKSRVENIKTGTMSLNMTACYIAAKSEGLRQGLLIVFRRATATEMTASQ